MKVKSIKIQFYGELAEVPSLVELQQAIASEYDRLTLETKALRRANRIVGYSSTLKASNPIETLLADAASK